MFRAIGGRAPTAAGARSGVVRQVPHAGALPDCPIREPHPEYLHPAARARPRVVPVVAARRASPRHLCVTLIQPSSSLGFQASSSMAIANRERDVDIGELLHSWRGRGERDGISCLTLNSKHDKN